MRWTTQHSARMTHAVWGDHSWGPMEHCVWDQPRISGMAELKIWNFAWIQRAGGPNENYAKVGHRGRGHVTYFSILWLPAYLRNGYSHWVLRVQCVGLVISFLSFDFIHSRTFIMHDCSNIFRKLHNCYNDDDDDSAFHTFEVGERRPASAGKAIAWFIPFADKSVQVKMWSEIPWQRVYTRRLSWLSEKASKFSGQRL